MSQFYRKPLTRRAVVMARSAFTTRSTMNMLMAEGDLGWGRKAWFLTDLSIQMMDCGQSANFKDVVISRVVARYHDSLIKRRRGEKPLCRTKHEREEVCRMAGGRPDKEDWFRKCGAHYGHHSIECVTLGWACAMVGPAL